MIRKMYLLPKKKKKYGGGCDLLGEFKWRFALIGEKDLEIYVVSDPGMYGLMNSTHS